MDYAVAGGEQTDIHRFIDSLLQELLTLVEHPPETQEESQKAKDIVDAIRKFYFKPSQSKQLNPIKAKIYFLHGIIHAHGLGGGAINENQAILSFSESARFGYKQAHASLGSIYFSKALSSKPDDLTKNTWAKKAIDEFEKGGAHTRDDLVYVLHTIYKQQLKLGKLAAARRCLEKLLTVTQLDEDDQLSIPLARVKEDLVNLDKLMSGINDAQLASVSFIECAKIDVKVVESEYLKITTNLSKTSNPVVDYYHMLILRKWLARLSNNGKPKDEDKATILALKQRVDAFKQTLLDPNSYDGALRSLVYFVYGLGLFEDHVFKEGELKETSAQSFFELAADEGCYLAYSYLGNMAQISPLEASDEPVAFYLKGAEADDPRCHMTYFMRFLGAKIDAALASENPEDIVLFCEETIDILQLARHNPFLVQENIPVVLGEIKRVDDYRRKYSDHPDELLPVTWQKVTDSQLTALKAEITQYDSLDNNNYKKRIYSLRKIDDLLSQALTYAALDKATIRLLEAAKLKIARAIDYITSKKILDEFDSYLKSSQEKRESDESKYFKTEGHMGHAHYPELVDPHHRLPTWLRVQWKESEWKDEPFAEYLSRATHLEADVPQAIYLDKYQREQIEIVANSLFELHFKQSGQAVEDGKYLYAIDKKKGRLYLHKESTDGQRSFYHSSFLRGKHVTCAGEMNIKNKRIVHINNGSGHYIPTVLQLAVAIEHLSELNLLDMKSDTYTIGIFGVKSVKKPLSYAQFDQILAKILDEEAGDRNMEVFAGLLPQPAQIGTGDAHDALTPTHLDAAIVGMVNEFIRATNKERFARNKQRVHPLLPTLQETVTPMQSALKVRSDHIPVYTTVPISVDRADDIKLLSLNTLGASAKNNLTRILESKTSTLVRYEAIARGLVATAAAQDVDVILLQEVTSEVMAPILAKMLSEGEWGMCPPMDVVMRDRPAQLTFYRKARLKLASEADIEFGRLSASFLHLKTKKSVHIHNVWTKYNIVPYDTELLSLIAGKESEEIEIAIVGDTNSRLHQWLTISS